MLRKKVKDFLDVSSTPKTVFCKRIGVSPVHFYGWLKGERKISCELEERMKSYIDSYKNSFKNF